MRLALFALVAAATLAVPVGLVAQDAQPADGVGATDELPLTSQPPLPWGADRSLALCDPDEMALLRDLRGRAIELDGREAALNRRETQIRALELEVTTDLERLERLRGELRDLIDDIDIDQGEGAVEMAKIVGGMKTRDAGRLLGDMNRDRALDVLRHLKPRTAAKVLGAMPPEAARELGDRLSRAVPLPDQAPQEQQK